MDSEYRLLICTLFWPSLGSTWLVLWTMPNAVANYLFKALLAWKLASFIVLSYVILCHWDVVYMLGVMIYMYHFQITKTTRVLGCVNSYFIVKVDCCFSENYSVRPSPLCFASLNNTVFSIYLDFVSCIDLSFSESVESLRVLNYWISFCGYNFAIQEVVPEAFI